MPELSACVYRRGPRRWRAQPRPRRDRRRHRCPAGGGPGRLIPPGRARRARPPGEGQVGLTDHHRPRSLHRFSEAGGDKHVPVPEHRQVADKLARIWSSAPGSGSTAAGSQAARMGGGRLAAREASASFSRKLATCSGVTRSRTIRLSPPLPPPPRSTPYVLTVRARTAARDGASGVLTPGLASYVDPAITCTHGGT